MKWSLALVDRLRCKLETVPLTVDCSEPELKLGTAGAQFITTLYELTDCGRVSKNSTFRPFHANIRQRVKVNQTVKICSGTLIDEDLVLTTRYCVVGVKGTILEYDEISIQLRPDLGTAKFGSGVGLYVFQ
jgi:hypothetical protein